MAEREAAIALPFAIHTGTAGGGSLSSSVGGGNDSLSYHPLSSHNS